VSRHVQRVSSHELVAEERPGFGWDVSIAGYVWACGLTEKDAQECIGRLAKAHMRPKLAQSAPRVECPFCHRSVAVIRGVLACHNEQESAPGRRARICKGYGAAPQ
jgi:hypothetical protein